ncbi:hypothetical protein [Neoaquamicrobium sediminum]|uniref:hypothetical protein n=1 Tax=Neoaquamicrobium sediminum TaxID=1849104 RepID=UPI0015676727|nr:hypothetical protein [Mesorhizobium sediminum]NRC55177.1 hypothetical protein [Mesorhizobium sediminum]
MGNLPWEKTLADLSKYDWLTAVSLNPRHQSRPRDLRVAIALMQLADAATCLAWPTQDTLASLTGMSNTGHVRAGLRSLKGTGAIEIVKISELSEMTMDAISVKRKGRGRAYKLKLFWAYEILEASRKAVYRRPVPEHLVEGKERKKTGANRSTIDRQIRSTIDRFKPVYDRPTNTTVDTNDTNGGFEGNVSRLASTRVVNAYAIASGVSDVATVSDAEQMRRAGNA